MNNIHASVQRIKLTAGGPGSGRHKQNYSNDNDPDHYVKTVKSLRKMGYERNGISHPGGFNDSDYQDPKMQVEHFAHPSGAEARVSTPNPVNNHYHAGSSVALDAPAEHHAAFQKLMSGPSRGRQLGELNKTLKLK